ncbi:RNA polymerase sigma factor [Flavobacterium rhizosphaerae]|uniref:Sigma-70 family RNA polymerase sigma factor n=1 Tax=Flavobacterium rhizosphaerae TaxID=3163298 RepID=A0ABW8Z2H7_9FLAO
MAHNTFIDKKSVFDSVYTENWKALYAFAYNILQDKESSEDILQEIFIDFWVRMEETEIQNFRAYLYQAIRNQCAKKLKNKKLTPVEITILEQSAQLAEEQEQNDFPKEEIIKEVRQKAQQILPEKCYEIFVLRFYEHMNISDIASFKNVSTSTVENQINKALKLLKQQNINYIKLLALLIAAAHHS